MGSKRQMGALCSLVICVVVSASAGEVRYAVTALPGTTDVVFRSQPSIEPVAVNSSGVVVGNVRGSIDYYYPEYGVWDIVQVERVFTWRPGMSELHVIDPTGNVEWDSVVTAINDSGVAVGRRDTGSYDNEVFKWDTGSGQFTSLAAPQNVNFHYPKAINNYGNGEVVADGMGRTVYWDSAGTGQVLLADQQGAASDISNTGVMVGQARLNRGTDAGGNVIYEERPFVYKAGSFDELAILIGGNSGEAGYVNDAGLIAGYTNVPRPQHPHERLEQPCYWDSSGTLHDLRDEFADWGEGSLFFGAVRGLSAENTMLINAGWDSGNSWLFNPGRDEDVVLLADRVNGAVAEGMRYFTARSMAENGTMVGQATMVAGGAQVRVVYMPYSVEISSLAAGSNQTLAVQGGLGSVGGCEVTFDTLTGPGSLATHYGQSPVENFAVTFLPEPAALEEIAGNLLPGDAQFWSLDLEESSYSGAIELTFQYDPALLQPGTNLDDLVILHHTGQGWETLVPTAHDRAKHTITVETDSLSPFLLGTVPEPSCLALLGLGGLVGLQRRRRG